MKNDMRRLFVQLVKDACDKYLAEGDDGVLGWPYDFEIERIELLPHGDSQSYPTVVRDASGAWQTITRTSDPLMFRVWYWNEFGDDENEPAHPVKNLGLAEVMSEVGKLIAGRFDLWKACNAMEWLRSNQTEPTTTEA
jgi:hypothetical protein